MLTKTKEIIAEVERYFDDVFCSSCPSKSIMSKATEAFPKRIIEEMNLWLTKRFTFEEIIKALFNMGATKAQGLDRFHAIFF